MAKNIPIYTSKKRLSTGGGTPSLRTAGLLSGRSATVSMDAGRVQSTFHVNSGPQIQSRQYDPPYQIDPKTGNLVADLSDSIYQAAVRLQDKVDTQIAKDKYYDLRARVRELYYGKDDDPQDVGYSGLHGSKAIAAHQSFVDSVNGVFKDNLNDLTPNQRQKYLALSQSFLNRTLQSAAALKQTAIKEKDIEQLSVAFSDARDTLQHDPAAILNSQNSEPSILNQLRTKMTALYGSEKADQAIDTMLINTVTAKSVLSGGEAARALYTVLSPHMSNDLARAKAQSIYERKIKIDKAEAKRQYDERVSKQLESQVSTFLEAVDKGTTYSFMDYYRTFEKIDPKHAASRASVMFNLQNNITKAKGLQDDGYVANLMKKNIIEKGLVASDPIEYLRYATSDDGRPAKITLHDASNLIKLSRMVKTQAGREAAQFYHTALLQARDYYTKLDNATLGVKKVKSIFDSGKTTQGQIMYKQFKISMDLALTEYKDNPAAQMAALNKVYLEVGKGKFAKSPGTLSHPIHIINNSFIFPIRKRSQEELESAEIDKHIPKHTQAQTPYDIGFVDKPDTMLDRIWNNQKKDAATMSTVFVAPQKVRMPVLEYRNSFSKKPTKHAMVGIDFAPYSNVVSTPNELAWWFQQAVRNEIPGIVGRDKILKAKNAMLSYLQKAKLIPVNDNDGFYWSDALDSYVFRGSDGAVRAFNPEAKTIKAYLSP